MPSVSASCEQGTIRPAFEKYLAVADMNCGRQYMNTFSRRAEGAHVRKEIRKLKILDGFRHPLSPVPRPQWGRYPQPVQKAKASHTHYAKASREHPAPTLIAMEQQLSALLEDRSRISQDLHDCILQSLYAIMSNMQVPLVANTHHVTSTTHSSADITGQINQLIGEIRQMINGLNSGVIKDSCLKTDLEALKSIYDDIGHVQITLDLQRTALEVLTRDEERELLNIIREALCNCVRHAQANHAVVSIRRRGSKIRVHISDDGNGFTLRDGRSRGYGFVTIESRAKRIGGAVRIQSEKGHGTQISVEFSLEPMLTPV